MKLILDNDDAAAFLFLPPEMLAAWRRAGIGPKPIPSTTRYRVEDLLAWLRAAASDQQAPQRVARETRRHA